MSLSRQFQAAGLAITRKKNSYCMPSSWSGSYHFLPSFVTSYHSSFVGNLC